MFHPGFFMVHDATRGSNNDMTKLTRRQQMMPQVPEKRENVLGQMSHCYGGIDFLPKKRIRGYMLQISLCGLEPDQYRRFTVRD